MVNILGDDVKSFCSGLNITNIYGHLLSQWSFKFELLSEWAEEDIWKTANIVIQSLSIILKLWNSHI